MTEPIAFFLFMFALGSVVMVLEYMKKRDELLSTKNTDIKEIVERLEKIEKRIENVETIVIEHRKKEEFERL